MYNNLKAEIARKGMTVKDFAGAVGMKQSTFAQKYRGNVDFTLPEAMRIKKFLNELPIEYLFEWTEGKKRWQINHQSLK